jgi:hypothetical protein
MASASGQSKYSITGSNGCALGVVSQFEFFGVARAPYRARGSNWRHEVSPVISANLQLKDVHAFQAMTIH